MKSFTPGISGATFSATSATPLEQTNAFASQSFTMYSTSPAVSFEEIAVKRRPERCAAHSTS